MVLKCVMLIDDDPDDNFLHQLVIEDTGLDPVVVVAESGLEAWQYLADTASLRPDIIFLDINMPGMDGFEFLERCKSLPSQPLQATKVVMLSTSAHPGDQRKASNIWKSVFYKTKPLTEEIIQEVMSF